MDSLHSIQVNNDLAVLKNATVKYSHHTHQLIHNGKPLKSWIFLTRKEAQSFAFKHGAVVLAV